MKKIFIAAMLVMALVFSYAANKSIGYFDKDGKCLICNGTGKVKNPEYSKKRFTAKKYLKCKNCNGTGKKAEEKQADKPKKYEVEVTCPKCKKKFVYKLPKDTATKQKRTFFACKCPHCKKRNLYRIDNPLYTP